jgi:50S ribosomal protein L16 3-hydroxylase
MKSVRAALADADALPRALGEALSEPKPQVVFDVGFEIRWPQALQLDRRTRMFYDERHVFINGESFRAAGRDAELLQLLADTRALPLQASKGFSVGARRVIEQWVLAGWMS